tara:strand:- start:1732 stop:3276 length:1545 start_codon:yes stop_codon:yes gene_type:complete
LNKKFIIEILLLLILGGLTSLSLPPFNFFLVNFFTLSIFFIFLFKKLDIQKYGKVFFLYGWLFGFSYFLSSLYWITISLTFDPNFNFLIPVALFLIPSFLGLFYGLATFIFYKFGQSRLLSSFFLFSLLFGLVEFLRGNVLTGFPWNLFIYSLSENLSFISFLAIIGTYSFNLLIISFFTAPAIYILRKSKIEVFISILMLLIPIFFLAFGKLYKQNFLNEKVVKNPYLIRIIGSNISLDRFYDDNQTENIINELIDLSSPEPNKRTFFLWPEGIIPNTYLDELKLYSHLFNENFNENHLIGLGISSRSLLNEKYKYFNSLSVIDSKLNLVQNYNKVNLVPFGEFLPFESLLNKIGLKTITNNIGSFTKGNDRKIIHIENNLQDFKYLPLICYEIIYSGNLSKDNDYDFVINISEDGWFGKSIGPKQHFSHSIFRAIETGKYVLRSSNNGMTAIINPLGEIEKKIDYNINGFIDFEERKDLNPTIFSLYGNKIFVLLILLYILLIFSFNRIKDE